MQNELKKAFQYHMRNERPPFYYAHEYKGKNAVPNLAKGIAVWAIKRARECVANEVSLYPQSVKGRYHEQGEGLRLVGRVEADFRGEPFTRRDSCGWYTDPHGDVFRDGSGLCFGVVYQISGRKGRARFVAGYQFGGVDGGPDLDFSKIFECDRGDSYWVYHGDKGDIPALREAARHADSMAKEHAEKEREYQTAWRAGSDWAQEQENAKEARGELRELLKERRKVKGQGSESYPALCAAIRAQVSELLQSIKSAKDTAAELARGDSDPLYFWPGEKRLQEAFCEGAGVLKFPNS